MNALKAFYKKHERWVPIAFFVLGFVFDAIMLQRIDHLVTILQQALYLILCALLIGVELIETTREIQPPRGLKGIWPYREAILHFMMGTLLNGYAIFFFKSASALVPYLFIIALVVVLILNEFKHFGQSRLRVHVAFWSLCLIVYMATLSPILFGFMGVIPFLAGVGAAVALFAGFYLIMKRKIPERPDLFPTHLRLPFLTIMIIFVLLYFLRAIPPVPMSVQYMGIFHDVQREDDRFILSYHRPSWRFWDNGDQTFLARPGDTIYCFARIFAPTRFNDQIRMLWSYHDERKGWVSSDAIPVDISGGREKGFRGVTQKNTYQPGEWRVVVETSDEREVGRIRFRVLEDASTGDRYVKHLVQ